MVILRQYHICAYVHTQAHPAKKTVIGGEFCCLSALK